MSASRMPTKPGDMTKKEMTSQLNAALAAVDHRKSSKESIEKEFITILRMKHDMELAHLKSMDKIRRMCQEKVDKHTENASLSSPASLVLHFIRAYGVSLGHRREALDDYIRFLSDFIEYMSLGLESISNNTVERSKDVIQQLYRELLNTKQLREDSGKIYRNALVEYSDAQEKYNSKKNRKISKSASLESKEAKLIRIMGRVGTLEEKLISSRFGYMVSCEQTSGLIALLDSEQQDEILFAENLYYQSFVKSLAEAYFKKEDDYLLKSRYCSSGCLAEVLSLDCDYTLPFQISPKFVSGCSVDFSSIALPKDKVENIFASSFNVVTKEVDFPKIQSNSSDIFDRRKSQIGKMSTEIDSWVGYCNKLTTNPINEWPKTFKVVQDNMLFQEMRIYFQLTQSYLKKKTYECLVHCALQKGTIMTVKSKAEGRKMGPFMLNLDDCERDKDGAPKIISMCFDFIMKFGLTSKGIFRISVIAQDMKDLEKKLADGQSIPQGTSVHIVAAVIKQLIRNISVFVTEQSYQILLKAKNFNYLTLDECYYICCEFIASLRPSSCDFFFYLQRKLYELSQNAEITLMNAYNLAIVFQPNIFKIESDINLTSITLLNDVYTFMIKNIEEISSCYEKYKSGKLKKEDLEPADDMDVTPSKSDSVLGSNSDKTSADDTLTSEKVNDTPPTSADPASKSDP